MKILFLLIFYFNLLFFNNFLLNTSNCFEFKSIKNYISLDNNNFILNETKISNFVVRLTKNGLNYLSLITNSILNKEFPNIKFLEIYLPIKTDVGQGFVYVNNLKVNKFYSPDIYLKFKPPNGVFLLSNDGSVYILGDWSAKYTFLIDFYASGWIEANVKNFCFKFLIQSYNMNDKPQINITNCTIQIQSLNIEIKGGAIPWIINMFKDSLNELIKQAIYEQFCLTAQTKLTKAINNDIQTIPLRFKLFNEIYIQYFYTNNLIIENDNIIAQANLNVMYKQQQCTVLSNPIWIDPYSPKNSMINFWISDSVFQCLANASQKANILKFVLTNQTDNNKLNTFLKTSCKLFELCLGNLFPKLKTNYPNSFIDLYIHSAKTPIIYAITHGILLKTYVFIDFFISPMNKNVKLLARLKLTSTFYLNPILKNNRISAILNDNPKFIFKQIYTEIGEFHEEILDLLSAFFEPILRKLIDGQLRVGIPLPLIKNITLGNNSRILTFGIGQISISSDLIYV